MDIFDVKIIKNKLKTFYSRNATVLGLLFSSILALLSISVTELHFVKDQLAALFGLTLLFVAVFWIINYRELIIILKQTNRHLRHLNRLENKNTSLTVIHDRYRKNVLKSDKAFRLLALRRAEFDNDIFVHAYSKPGIPGERRKRMAEEVEAYLKFICNTAVEVFSARQDTEKDAFQANIKVIEKINGRFVYRTPGRSPNTPARRMEKDKSTYDVASNYVFDKAILNLDRFHIIDDVRKEVEEYGKIDREYTSPTPKAWEWYTSSMSVLMYIKPAQAILLEDADNDVETYETERGDWLYGMMTIDSKIYKFDSNVEEDFAIIAELAIQALSALRFHARLRKVAVK